MPLPVQQLWQSVSHIPLVRHFVRERHPYTPADEAGDFPVQLPMLEDGEPTAREINAQERDRAEQFKRDQLLPIVGMAGPPY